MKMARENCNLRSFNAVSCLVIIVVILIVAGIIATVLEGMTIIGITLLIIGFVVVPLGGLFYVKCRKRRNCCVLETHHQRNTNRPTIPATSDLVINGQLVSNTDSSLNGLCPWTSFFNLDSPPSYAVVMANKALYPALENNRGALRINGTDNDDDVSDVLPMYDRVVADGMNFELRPILDPRQLEADDTVIFP